MLLKAAQYSLRQRELDSNYTSLHLILTLENSLGNS
jgi:hypothetical protein